MMSRDREDASRQVGFNEGAGFAFGYILGIIDRQLPSEDDAVLDEWRIALRTALLRAMNEPPFKTTLDLG